MISVFDIISQTHESTPTPCNTQGCRQYLRNIGRSKVWIYKTEEYIYWYVPNNKMWFRKYSNDGSLKIDDEILDCIAQHLAESSQDKKPEKKRKSSKKPDVAEEHKRKTDSITQDELFGSDDDDLVCAKINCRVENVEEEESKIKKKSISREEKMDSALANLQSLLESKAKLTNPCEIYLELLKWTEDAYNEAIARFASHKLHIANVLITLLWTMST